MSLSLFIALTIGSIFVFLNNKKFENYKILNSVFSMKTFHNKILDSIGISLLIVLWSMSLYYYKELPETIPIHFNGLGEADGYGNKKTIFMLPIIATMLFLFLYFVSKNPESFNYSTKITPENKEQQYKNAVRLMKVMGICIPLIFLIIDYSTIKIALENKDHLSVYILPIVLSIIILPIIYFTYKSYKLK